MKMGEGNDENEVKGRSGDVMISFGEGATQPPISGWSHSLSICPKWKWKRLQRIFTDSEYLHKCRLDLRSSYRYRLGKIHV